MVETAKTKIAVLESPYSGLEDLGIPPSVCLQLQQLGLQLDNAQWTARHSLVGFSISFFWVALEKTHLLEKSKKSRRKKVKVKSPSQPKPKQGSTNQALQKLKFSIVGELQTRIAAHLSSQKSSRARVLPCVILLYAS